MAKFSAYYPKLMRNEGDYCHNLNDTGGETYRGISRVHHPEWSGWKTINAVKEKHNFKSPVAKANWAILNKELRANHELSANIEKFYQALYWDTLRLNEVDSQSIAEQLADHGVNAGTSRPAKMLQFLLNDQYEAKLRVDGKIGPQTIKTLNEVLPRFFYADLVEMRQAFYYYLADSPISSTPNMPGWRDFLHNTLLLRPRAKNKGFLKSWLSRTREAFVS